MSADITVLSTKSELSRRFKERLSADLTYYFGSILSLLVVWEFIGRAFRPLVLPPFTEVLIRLGFEIGERELLHHAQSSLINLGVGFAIAASAGVIIGFAMGLYPPVEIALNPYVYGLMTAPTIVFLPIYFSLFGLSRWSIIALIVQYTVFIVIVNVTTGVKQVRRELMEMAMVFGASSVQRTLRVVLPSALPFTLAGMRIGLSRAIKGMINGELLIAYIGLGGAIIRYGRVFDAEGVLALVVFITSISLIFLKAVAYWDARATRWLPAQVRS